MRRCLQEKKNYGLPTKHLASVCNILQYFKNTSMNNYFEVPIRFECVRMLLFKTDGSEGLVIN